MLSLLHERSNLSHHSQHLTVEKKYNVAAICEKCRMHFNIEVEFTKPVEFDGEAAPCPIHDPLHHFRYETSLSIPLDPAPFSKNSKERWTDKRVFSCSSPTCPVLVTIIIRAPMLTPDLATLLIDESRLEARMAVAGKVSAFPAEVELAARTPFEALEALCTYLKNHKAGDQRAVFTENLRFLCSIGRDGGEIMKKAHFTLVGVSLFYLRPTS